MDERLRAIWGKKSFDSVRFEDNGSLVDEEVKQPRRDFGPIGGEVMKRKKEVPGLMFSWASDYIKPGGGLVEGDLRGLVPTMGTGKVPVFSLLNPRRNKDVCRALYPPAPAPNEKKSAVGIQGDKVLLDNTCDSKPRLANWTTPLSLSVPQENDDTASASGSSGYGSAPNSPEWENPPQKRPTNANDRDIKEFVERFGYVGQIRPGLLYRPRKGKYFKPF